MPAQITEDEIDDLIYFARAGEEADLEELVAMLAAREKVSTGEIVAAARDEGKSTCLHMAAGNDHIGIVVALLQHLAARPRAEALAYLDAANEFGNTALHWAAMNGRLTVVQRLVEAGAAPAPANDKNYVPLDLAGLNDHRAVVDYFLAQAQKLEADGEGQGLAAGLEAAGLEEGAEEPGEDGDAADATAEGNKGHPRE